MKIELKENRKNTVQGLSEDDLLFLSRSVFDLKIKVKKLLGGLGHEIYPDNVVGAIRLPSGIQLNIAPKIPLPNLFRMMSYVGGLYEPLESEVEYEKDRDLFDILAGAFAREFSHLLRVGMKQNYSSNEQVLRTLKGQILFSSSIGKGLIGSGKLDCRFERLSLDTPLNQAVVTAAKLILRSDVVTSGTKKAVRQCLNQIPSDLIASNFSISDFNQIHLDRSTDFYRRILFVSRFIIGSASFDNKFGENQFPGFLLDVSRLFEQYVATALKETQKGWELKVSSQTSSHLDTGHQVEVRPDLTFLRDGKVKYIADTKYKDFSDLKFRNEDVYQMLAYLIRHRCRQGFLIYPAFDPKEVGLLKSIHIPTEIGDISVHGVCVGLDSPQDVVAKIKDALIGLDEPSKVATA